MVDSRYLDIEIDRTMNIGRDNGAVRADVEGWCEHLVAEIEGISPLGQMAALPIGMHRLSCRYAEYSISAIGLRDLFEGFLVDNCLGCSEHRPGKHPDYGKACLEVFQQRKAKVLELENARRIAIEDKRRKLLEMAGKFAAASESESESLYRMLAELFANPDGGADLVLLETTALAPDLFDDKIVEILEWGASDSAFAEMTLPVLTSLARRREDIRERIRPKVIESFQLSLPIEMLSDALDACLSETGCEIDDRVIDRLISSQNYQRPIGGWEDDEQPTFKITLDLLRKVFDRSPDRVTSCMSSKLKTNNKYVRANTNRIVEQLAKARSSIAFSLLSSVIHSLELHDDAYEGVSADGSAVSVVAELLSRQWDDAERIVHGEMAKLSDDAQIVLVGAYERIFRRGDNWRERSTNDLDSSTVNKAVKRCLELLIDTSQEPGIRRAAAEAIRSAMEADAESAIDAFEQLLGCLAILVDSSQPPTPPQRIIIPGQEHVHEQQEAIRKQNRATEWTRLRQELEEIVEALGESNPTRVGEALLGTIVSSAESNRQPLRRIAIKLLGKVAAHDNTLPLASLPIFMQCLMDYTSDSSAAIRAAAIDAVFESLRSRRLTVPTDIVDVVIVHLHDPFIIVHKTAVGALWRRYVPLNDKQRDEAFSALFNIWNVYSKDPRERYFMDDIAEAMRSIARDDVAMRNATTYLICEYLPSGDSILDSRLCELLMRLGEDNTSHPVKLAQSLIKCLRQYRRDEYRTGIDWRKKAAYWLSSCPKKVWKSVRDQLKECATHAVSIDPPDAILFASIFCEHGDYAVEADVLQLAATASTGHSMFHRLTEHFRTLTQQALTCHEEYDS